MPLKTLFRASPSTRTFGASESRRDLLAKITVLERQNRNENNLFCQKEHRVENLFTAVMMMELKAIFVCNRMILPKTIVISL